MVLVQNKQQSSNQRQSPKFHPPPPQRERRKSVTKIAPQKKTPKIRSCLLSRFILPRNILLHVPIWISFFILLQMWIFAHRNRTQIGDEVLVFASVTEKQKNKNKHVVDIEESSPKNDDGGQKKLIYYGDELWDNLSLDLQIAATLLGYNQLTWDNGNDQYNEIVDESWNDLTSKEQEAATKLGFNEQIWDYGDEEDDDDESSKPFQKVCNINYYQQQERRRRRRPNVVFLMTDQQRYDAIRRVQNELRRYDNQTKIRTPNLDRLSERGAYFRNTYTQCSVCGPARTSLRTGLTIERSGIQTNSIDNVYHKQTPDYIKHRVESARGLDHVLVEELGYHSEYYGKLHIPDMLIRRSSSTTTTTTTTAKKVENKNCSIISSNHYNWNKEEFVFHSQNWGWGTEDQYRDHLKQFEHLLNITELLVTEPGMQIDTCSEYPYTPIHLDSRYGHPTNTRLNRDFPFYERSQPNICGNFSLPANYTSSYFTGTLAVKALKRLMKEQQQIANTQNRHQHDNEGDGHPRPFFLTVSWHSPHAPMIPAWKHLEYYWEHRANLFVPPSIHDSMESSPYVHDPGESPKYTVPEYIQEWTALYYALVEEIDEHIGKILQQLSTDSDIDDNTLIVFTSDHGEMLGAHGKREKNNFYEESARVPLFVSLPGIIPENATIDELTSHLDVFSTILDYIGASSFDNSDGGSLRPLIEKSTTRSNIYNHDYDENTVVAEWDFRDPVEDGTRLSRTIDDRPSFMIRKGPFKLMMHKKSSSDHKDALYNLETDPFEMNNLLHDDDDAVSVLSKAEHLRCLLLDWMERMDGSEGYYSDAASNFGEGEGDMEEIRKRQSWRPLPEVWISDSKLEFGKPVVFDGGLYVRNEFLYVGYRTLDPSSTIVTIRIGGKDAECFTVDKDEIEIESFQCTRIKVAFSSPSSAITFASKTNSLDAFVILQNETSGEKTQIELLLSTS